MKDIKHHAYPEQNSVYLWIEDSAPKATPSGTRGNVQQPGPLAPATLFTGEGVPFAPAAPPPRDGGVFSLDSVSWGNGIGAGVAAILGYLGVSALLGPELGAIGALAGAAGGWFAGGYAQKELFPAKPQQDLTVSTAANVRVNSVTPVSDKEIHLSVSSDDRPGVTNKGHYRIEAVQQEDGNFLVGKVKDLNVPGGKELTFNPPRAISKEVVDKLRANQLDDPQVKRVMFELIEESRKPEKVTQVSSVDARDTDMRNAQRRVEVTPVGAAVDVPQLPGQFIPAVGGKQPQGGKVSVV
jgi:hypothetical protein